MPKEPQVCFRTTAQFRDEFVGTARIRGTTAQAVLETFAKQWLAEPFLKHSEAGMSADADKSVPNSPKSIDADQKTADNRSALAARSTDHLTKLIRQAEARGLSHNVLVAVRAILKNKDDAGAKAAGEHALPGSDADSGGGTEGDHGGKATSSAAPHKRTGKRGKASG